MPDSLPDCFRALAEAGIVSTELANNLAAMARFRNLLVHRYCELDYGRVHQYLRESLGDLEKYLELVGQHLGASF